MNSFLIQCKVRKTELLQFLELLLWILDRSDRCIYRDERGKREYLCNSRNHAGGHRLCFYTFIWDNSFFYGDFNMAISLGATRKSFVSGYVLLICWRSQCWNLRSLCLV